MRPQILSISELNFIGIFKYCKSLLANAPLPIVTTLLGIVISSILFPEKASSWIEFRLLGRVISLKSLLKNAHAPISCNPLPNWTVSKSASAKAPLPIKVKLLGKISFFNVISGIIPHYVNHYVYPLF